MAEDNKTEETVKKVPTGMVEFTFGKNHGTRKKDEVVMMHKSTADALAEHKLGKITKTLTRVEKTDK